MHQLAAKEVAPLAVPPERAWAEQSGRAVTVLEALMEGLQRRLRPAALGHYTSDSYPARLKYDRIGDICTA